MNTYDQVAYINAPLTQTHPSRLHVTARLHGLRPPPVDRCRVLELGASEGANLIGLAIAMPDAEFVGIDLAGTPVARGNQMIADLGLSNVRLQQMNLLDLEPSFGEFHYILVHGIYAWTPEIVRDRVLAVASANLHPDGVAFISYNTYPGAYLRQAMREMALYHVEPLKTPEERLRGAREFTASFAGARPDPDALDTAFAAIAAELADSTDSSLFHDDLTDIYHPVYFHQFVSHAAQHGLQYIDDAATFDAYPRNLSEEAFASAQGFGGGDWIRTQQHFDFLRGRTFRQSLVGRAGKAPSPHWQPDHLEGCFASTLARETRDGAFVLPDGNRLTTNQPEPIAFLRRLSATWPRASRIGNAETEMAAQFLRMGLIQIHAFEGLAAKAGQRPCASPLVRYQMARGINPVTTLWQEPLEFSEDPPVRLVSLLDGTRSRAELAAAMECAAESIDEQLAELSYYAILTA